MQAMDRLSRELELTAEQRQQVETLMAKRTERFRALRDEYEPRMRQLVDEGQRELEAVLTPAQRERFAALRERWLRPRGPRPDSGPGENWPPGGPPPGIR
jgi:Spy/CpxP family protein refolding chaperone